MVLITGATGHLGNTLARELLARGQKVRALVLPGEDCSSLASLELERVEGDVLEPRSLGPALRAADLVYHLVYLRATGTRPAPPRGERAGHVERGAGHARRRHAPAGVRQLHPRLGPPPPAGVPIDESVPFDPHNAEREYDRSKADASRIVQQARDLEAVIACPTGIIGPFDFRESEMGRLLRSWLAPGLHPISDGRFDFVDVRDVALGRPLAVIALPRWLALAAVPLAALAGKVSGRPAQFTSYSLRTLASNAQVSHAKAERELGYAVRPPAQTLADTVRWWVEHPGIAAPRLHRRKPEPARQRERLALVTGASGGIGGQTARRLAATGYRVVLVARRQDRLDRLAAEIRAAGGAAEVLVADLASSDGPQAVYEQVMERFGGIDVLVNTASLTQLIVLFLPVMRRAGHGHVINVSSRAGSLPSQGWPCTRRPSPSWTP
jgi:dihydroflavonol-4-reductase